MPNIQSKPMHQGAFVLKIKTSKWRLCLVKQVPEQSSSCWMLFGQNMKCDQNMKCGQNMKCDQKNMKDKTTFQMEFTPCQETTLINHIVNMADTDETNEMDFQIRLVLIRESPKISHIGSLWALKGLEMYRKQLDTASGLVNSLHQDVNMLRLSPQIEQIEDSPQIEQIEDSPQIDRHHSMQTRSKAKH